jgi:hypothetical protein
MLAAREGSWHSPWVYNYLFDKKKGKLFFTGFFSSADPSPPGALVIKQLFLAREQKNSGKKFFLFMEHEVLFYETPFLQRASRNYVCGACERTAD